MIQISAAIEEHRVDSPRFRALRHQLADGVRGDLTNLLPVDAGDDEFRLFINGDIDSRRQRILDWMRKTESKDNRILLRLRAESNTDNLQFLSEPYGHTLHSIRDKRARQAV